MQPPDQVEEADDQPAPEKTFPDHWQVRRERNKRRTRIKRRRKSEKLHAEKKGWKP